MNLGSIMPKAKKVVIEKYNLRHEWLMFTNYARYSNDDKNHNGGESRHMSLADANRMIEHYKKAL